MPSGQKSNSGPKVSTNMRKGIKAIEEILGIQYKGKTFDDAHKFLDEYLPKIKDKDIRDYRPPSDKMLKGIEIIRRTLGVEFDGSTMREASEFLDEYLPQASEIISRRSKK